MESKKTEMIHIRVTEEEKKELEQLAAIKAATETSPELIEEMCKFARSLGNLEKIIDAAREKENTDTLAHIARTWIKEIRENNGQWELTLNLPVRLPNLSGDPACTQTNHRILLMRGQGITVYAMAKAA